MSNTTADNNTEATKAPTGVASVKPISVPEPVKESYFLPDFGISVMAVSVADAVAQAKKLKAKKEGDGNI